LKIEYTKDTISIEDKVISALDRFVLAFINLLEKYTDYVIVSGYVPILFGRSRGTEDIDILVRRFDKDAFTKFYDLLIKKSYYFLNPEDVHGLYEMLGEELGIRAAKKDTIIPNVELKFVKNDFDVFSIDKKVKVVLSSKKYLFISPLELEIPYKLYLGSDKDIEDAVYLWDIFSDKIDIVILNKFMKKLNVEGKKYGIGI
jgi:hypothetical protein